MEDNGCFAGCDPEFATHVGLLSSAAVSGRGRHCWCFCLLGSRATLAIRAFDYPPGTRFLSGLSWDALPDTAKQDCNRLSRSGRRRFGSCSSLSSGHRQRTRGFLGQTQMKKQTGILGILVIAAVLALGWHFYSGERVPAEQPPLLSLTSANFDQLRTAFNSASGEVRVVLLLSPT